jgi:hypothetical protein
MGQAKHGKKYVVKIDNAGGVLTERSNNFKSVDFEENVELLDSTAFQDTDKTYEVGFKDNKFSGSGNWTAAIDAHLGAILGQDATVSFELGPEGSTTGSVKYTGECRLVSFKKNGSVSSLNTFTAEFQISGPVTRGTYA